MTKQPSFLQNRLSQQITKALAVILQTEVRDPRLGIVTISEVKVSADMSIAKVYITAINNNSTDDKASSTKILNKMASFLRTLLASKISVRNIPELRFYADNTIENSNRIEELLAQAKQENTKHDPENDNAS